MFELSRRISSMIQPDGGRESQHRTVTYMFASSKAIQTSVFSVAGAPGFGSI